MDIIDEIIRHVGSGAGLGRICGAPDEQARKAGHYYKRTRRIPPEHWRAIVRHIPGMTIDRLYDGFYPEQQTATDSQSRKGA